MLRAPKTNLEQRNATILVVDVWCPDAGSELRCPCSRCPAKDSKGGWKTYSAKAGTKSAAEDAVVTQCVESEEAVCPVLFNECMHAK
ncbi:hypothetical protein [Stenotrophomonas chelatiphaga]|uniref:hypothetical protein n=1 Tax=Stenotrophomonas chelatiphaga TaxID=517011 RepID=UPI002897CB4B|nr:hypothetical protein [Stenotrophomonas chelatiphaga]